MAEVSLPYDALSYFTRYIGTYAFFAFKNEKAIMGGRAFKNTGQNMGQNTGMSSPLTKETLKPWQKLFDFIKFM